MRSHRSRVDDEYFAARYYKYIIISFFLYFTLVSPLDAGFISLKTGTAVNVDKNVLDIKIVAVNKGDESAFGVQAELLIAGQSILLEKKQELTVDASYQVKTSIPLPYKLPGNYPIILVMHYNDANMYPFSALTAQTFVVGKEGVSSLFGQLSSVVITHDGRVELVLRNSGEHEIKAESRLIAPREITVINEKQTLIVSPRQERRINFSIRKFSALPGSTYQVFSVTEFDEGGLHYTCLAPGMVKIDEENFLVRYRIIIIIMITILVIAFVALQFVRK